MLCSPRAQDTDDHVQTDRQTDTKSLVILRLRGTFFTKRRGYQVDIDVVAAHRMNDAFKFEFIFRALEVLGEDVVKSFLWSFFLGAFARVIAGLGGLTGLVGPAPWPVQDMWLKCLLVCLRWAFDVLSTGQSWWRRIGGPMAVSGCPRGVA